MTCPPDAPGLLPSGDPYLPPTDPLAIVHSDDAVLVIDKPSGLLSVTGKNPGLEDCLEARVKAAFPEALLLHRLDMDTSGVTVFARSRLAQRHLAWQFQDRRIGKTYVARVWGKPDAAAGQVDAPLTSDWPNRPLQKICHQAGRPSVTKWEVLSVEGPLTRLKVTPVTGRSHQIRVHLTSIGLPIAGDRFYATGAALAAADRLQLHAQTLRFQHPTGGAWVSYSAPPPF